MSHLLHYMRRTIMFARQHHSQLHIRRIIMYARQHHRQLHGMLLIVALLASMILLAHSLAITRQAATHYAPSLHPSIGYPHGASSPAAVPYNSTPQVAYSHGASSPAAVPYNSTPQVAYSHGASSPAAVPHNSTPQVAYPHSASRLDMVYPGRAHSYHRLSWRQLIHRLSWRQLIHRLSMWRRFR